MNGNNIHMNRMNFESIQSESIALKFLKDLHPDSSQSSLYRSAARVASSARLTNEFRKTAEMSNFCIQPLLRYYTVLHGMKTVMYTRDLAYPGSSSVLQHGISVRRTKRDTYSWAKEFVHVYKEGVLQSFASLHQHQLPIGSRITIGDVLGHLPGLHLALDHTHPEHHHVHPVRQGRELGYDDNVCLIPRAAASNLHMTVDEWRALLLNELPERKLKLADLVSHVEEPDGYMVMPSLLTSHPWMTKFGEHPYIFDTTPHPSWLIHFVVLYTLSALCRYNPTEWSDITLWNNDTDAFLIREYLKLYPMDAVMDALV